MPVSALHAPPISSILARRSVTSSSSSIRPLEGFFLWPPFHHHPLKKFFSELGNRVVNIVWGTHKVFTFHKIKVRFGWVRIIHLR